MAAQGEGVSFFVYPLVSCPRCRKLPHTHAQAILVKLNGSQKTDMKIEGDLGKKGYTENRRNRKDNEVTVIVRHLHHV